MASFLARLGMGNKESAAGGGRGPPASVAQRNVGTPAAANAMQTQRDAIANLDKKMDYLSLQATQERNKARSLMQLKTDKVSNKEKAKRHLIAAKRFETQSAKYAGMRDNLQAVLDSLDAAAISKTTTSALQSGAATMKNMQKEMDVDKVDDLIGDLQETQQNMEEVSNIISAPIFSDGVQDFDEAELDALMAENDELEEEAPAPAVKAKKPAAKIPSLPEAPKGKVELPMDEEDEELSALEREMN